MQINRYAIIASILAIVVVTTTTAFSQEGHSQQMTSIGSYGKIYGYDKVLIMHITSGEADDPHQVHKATMGVDHTLAWNRAGMNVVIFLDAEGVLIGTKDVPTELSTINNNLKTFLAEGGRVIACSHCVMMHGLESDDMLPSIEIDTHPTMNRVQDLLRNGATVLDY